MTNLEPPHEERRSEPNATGAARGALYLIDGSNFLFRAYHALPPLSTRAGVPSGAVYGFTQMLLKLELDHRPSHLAVVFDVGGRSFRNEVYSAYKANRKEPPDDLKPQFALVRRVVDAFAIPILEAVGYEADDLIATLSRRAIEHGLRVIVVSSDKDLMQLVGEHCLLLDTMKDFTYGPDEVREKFGVGPERLGDVLALMGDSIDNVPGVPGVGPKTASALIRHFGSLEALLRQVDQIPAVKGLRGAAQLAPKIAEYAEAVRLSRRLVELDDAMEVNVDLDSLRRKEPDMARLEGIFRELEFTRLVERLRPSPGGPEHAAAPAVPPAVGVDPKPEVSIGREPPRLVTSEVELEQLAAELDAAEELAIAIESSGGPPVGASLVGIGFAFATPHVRAAYLPLGHRYLGAPAQLSLPHALERLAPALAGNRPRKHVHSLKDARVLLKRHGLELAGVVSDPMIASYLLDPAQTHDLASVCKLHLDFALDGRADLCGSGKKAVLFEAIEIGRALRFAGCEAEATLELGRLLRRELERRQMTALLDDIELPLSGVLAIMEAHGIRLDVAALKRLGEAVAGKLEAIEDEVRALTGTDVNLGSPKQLQELLFGKLGLPSTRRTKTGFSTDADVLEELAPLHPVAAKILEHRMLAKLKGTYIDALPQLVDPRTGRLHTSYNQTVAATGRLSSSDPNLQNVPIRSELGREIRRAFLAEPGYRLIVADYSQIELRVLAHLSGDPVLTDAFRKDQDIHQRTVVEMFGAAKEKDRELRRVAKMINYGIVYGLSDFGLAARLGIERADAKRYIDSYLATYAGVAAYMDSLIAEARRAGGSRTLLGRFRPLPELASPNRNLRMAGERMARNTPIQGTAADLLKLAMIAVQRFLDDEAVGGRMLLTVHDELVLEVPEAQAGAVAERLREMMEGVAQLAVPLKVDLGVGATWADAK